MARKSVVPQLSETQKNILEEIVKRRDSAQQLVRRAKTVLLAAEGQDNKKIVPQTHFCQRSVRTWRNRWNKQQKKIDAIEADGNEKALLEFIVDVVLADDPYNGKRGKYTPEQIALLDRIACEPPQDSGRPISHWTCRELADEMVKRGIVEHLPASTVWDFLKSGRSEAAQGGRVDESKTRRSGGICTTK
jgi:putative transposase